MEEKRVRGVDTGSYPERAQQFLEDYMAVFDISDSKKRPTAETLPVQLCSALTP